MDETGFGLGTPGSLDLQALLDLTQVKPEDVREYGTLSRRERVRLIAQMLCDALERIGDGGDVGQANEAIRKCLDDAMGEAWSQLLSAIDPALARLRLRYFPANPPAWTVENSIVLLWQKEMDYFSAYCVVEVLSKCSTSAASGERPPPPVLTHWSRTREPEDIQVPRLAEQRDSAKEIEVAKSSIEAWQSEITSGLKDNGSVGRDAIRNVGEPVDFLDSAGRRLREAIAELERIEPAKDCLEAIFRWMMEGEDDVPDCKLAIASLLVQMGHGTPPGWATEIEEARSQLARCTRAGGGQESAAVAALRCRLLMRAGRWSELVSELERCTKGGRASAELARVASMARVYAKET